VPLLERDGLKLQYWIDGEGYPLTLIAPGGMHSVAQMWRESPSAPGQPMPWIDPPRDLAANFGVISMDQRNAGGSSAPVSAGDGWRTYTADHLALLDSLGIVRTHLMGGCIGSSYCLSICRVAPERVTAAVLQNPIGLTEDNRKLFLEMFDTWGEGLQRSRPDVSPEALAQFRENMFGGDFVFSVDREFVARCPVPLLVLPGNDPFHPTVVAEEIVSLAPDAELLRDWAGPDRKSQTRDRIREFLLAHTPPEGR
jgi:pimeloyl-ACP methyl ester carboxylesterase